MASPIRDYKHIEELIKRIRRENKEEYRKKLFKMLFHIIMDFAERYPYYKEIFEKVCNILYHHRKMILEFDQKELHKFLKDYEKLEKKYKRNKEAIHTLENLRLWLFNNVLIPLFGKIY